MKKILFTAVAALCLLAGAATVFAQEHPLRADISFGFCVGNTALPAGTYLIGAQTGSQCNLVIRNNTTGEAIFYMTRPAPRPWAQNTGSLTFNRYGDQYFLREIRGPLPSNNLLLPISTREQKVQEEFGTVTVYEHVTVPSEKD